jgi:hypothetical protein
MKTEACSSSGRENAPASGHRDVTGASASQRERVRNAACATRCLVMDCAPCTHAPDPRPASTSANNGPTADARAHTRPRILYAVSDATIESRIWDPTTGFSRDSLRRARRRLRPDEHPFAPELAFNLSDSANVLVYAPEQRTRRHVAIEQSCGTIAERPAPGESTRAPPCWGKHPQIHRRARAFR